MKLTVELVRQMDGRWLAEVRELGGMAVFGEDRLDAFRRAEAMALRTLATRLESGKPIHGAPAELALSFNLV
jgi:predicted RNase H-like HicB family nuclease